MNNFGEGYVGVGVCDSCEVFCCEGCYDYVFGWIDGSGDVVVYFWLCGGCWYIGVVVFEGVFVGMRVELIVFDCFFVFGV